ncbi:hypothetical protein HG530_013603 [Fusarium avenaceum]|nr:hypothetical protein HG530_013603 [Fusarium avenaceum]
MHFLDRRRLVSDGQAVQHHIRICHRLAVLAGAGAGPRLVAMPGMLSGAIDLPPRIWRCWRGVVDVAGIAIISGIIIVGQGAVGDRIVIEVEALRATLVFALILDTATLPDKLSTARSSRGHNYAAVKEKKEPTEGASETRWLGCDGVRRS